MRRDAQVSSHVRIMPSLDPITRWVEDPGVGTRGIALFGLVIATLLALPATSATRSFPGRGRVTVHGQRIWFQCSGSGSPAVVFDAAAGYDSTEWAAVQPAVAKTTRACAYDRLGEGKSDAVRPGILETADSDAKMLRAVLAAAHIEPPYILVAHSWAGPIAERFAYDYRDKVAGIVLVDSQQADVIGRWLAMLPAAPKQGIDPFAQVRAELKQALKPLDGDPEHFDIPASVPQLHQVRSLGSVPLVVLTAGTSQLASALPATLAAHSYRIWLQGQSKLAALSSDSVHAIVTTSDHFIPENDRATVVAATRSVIVAARSHGRLAGCRAMFRGLSRIHCP
jgi:pimeloyl-ACP methyl ester carboxylesterase